MEVPLLVFLVLVCILYAQAKMGGLEQGPDGTCSGYVVDSSKYCSAFGQYSLLLPDVVERVGITLFGLRELKDDKSAQLEKQIASIGNITSVQDFDERVMQQLVLPNIELVQNYHFHCMFSKLGVKYIRTWACDMILNHPDKKCQRKGAPLVNPSLCPDTVNEMFNQARERFSKDESCTSHTLESESLFKTNLNQLLQNYLRLRGYDEPTWYNKLPTHCISGELNEKSSNFCGEVGKSQACYHKCGDVLDTCVQSSTNIFPYILLAIAAIVLLALSTVWVQAKRKSRSNDDRTPCTSFKSKKRYTPQYPSRQFDQLSWHVNVNRSAGAVPTALHSKVRLPTLGVVKFASTDPAVQPENTYTSVTIAGEQTSNPDN